MTFWSVLNCYTKCLRFKAQPRKCVLVRPRRIICLGFTLLVCSLGTDPAGTTWCKELQKIVWEVRQYWDVQKGIRWVHGQHVRKQILTELGRDVPHNIFDETVLDTGEMQRGWTTRRRQVHMHFLDSQNILLDGLTQQGISHILFISYMWLIFFHCTKS